MIRELWDLFVIELHSNNAINMNRHSLIFTQNNTYELISQGRNNGLEIV